MSHRQRRLILALMLAGGAIIALSACGIVSGLTEYDVVDDAAAAPGEGGPPINNEASTTGDGSTSNDGTLDGGPPDANETLEAGCHSTAFVNGTTASFPGPDAGEAWNNPDQALDQNNKGARSSVTPGEVTALLSVRGFGFSFGTVPPTAAIRGVRVHIVRRDHNGDVKDQLVVLETTLGISASQAAPDLWPDNFALQTYGDVNNMWGLALTPAIIKQPEFGVGISVGQSASGRVDPEVDAISVSVTYCEQK